MAAAAAGYERGVMGRGKKVKERPKDKVRMVLRRLSRNRWILPRELRNITWALCRRYSSSPWNVCTAVIGYGFVGGACEMTGMFRGEPLLFMGEPGYFNLVEVLRQYQDILDSSLSGEQKESLSMIEELKILTIICQRTMV